VELVVGVFRCFSDVVVDGVFEPMKLKIWFESIIINKGNAPMWMLLIVIG
jgi:hypothetical protein